MATLPPEDRDASARDLAARAAWLSFVGGLTQDQIATELGISRQRAQRLVARAGQEGLIRVRIEHPIAACLELERALKARFGLAQAWVSPSLGDGADPMQGLARFTAPVLERMFATEPGRTFALGTGRTLRMVVDQMSPLEGAHNRLVSLIGNVAPDGSASFFEVIMRFAEITGAKHYPMSIPVAARNREELELFRSLPHVRAARDLAQSADLAIVGIGQMSDNAPLHVDGFLSAEELADLQAAGAVGEICGHVYDSEGRYLDHPINQRVTGVQVPTGDMPVYAVACGATKMPGLRAALKGHLLHGLFVDELSARALLTA
ncbi:sugar-binding transcriptional regulator [Pseudooceanicola sp. CBS1P-1]|uniref:Sugar-binding transcriptional regulator n=1 Tax=Pseudooceanicola albus TaxID=2692189 RepID=A0A6L7G9B3_9RHOB|nr:MULTISPECIES: sugar-binding transcriptional regulator [Pseudooceanicola]MBT9382889.1 sugar-binding transcriptional regulator [Pseudooceanicola endophyticus]MXN20187.1 sugar-binding transcriptional regulator [Pseudooceanicola albus]